MIIRNALIDDLKGLATLFDGYRVFYKKESDLAGAEYFLKKRLESTDSVIFVTEDLNNTLIGFVQLYPLFSSTRMKRLWLLNDLFVHPGFRGMGISIGLIDKAKELCRNTDACRMMLETSISNIIGNNLYPKMGFELNTESNFYEWANA